ncbi:SdiA-regulated domain-containing protein [Algoriphagus sp. CAU 1675]|uniref:SdiA-regulated domain-containing protein n=1 Tax=Algoriphagus sp. CAU 1675 TaxID=3032597 RepID=UPI0023D9DA61|nr:SdiA-regulated domain-containing protein [Algoriphagus sp. CAU 1675]MDF2158560.1 SdiA-regulated domain-containing protein [Algoriphagus sp. CAU 1675]
MKYFNLVAILAGLLAGCQSQESRLDQFSFPEPYDLNEVQKVFLPDELEEVSGLEWTANNELWAIEDESSVLYQINPETGKILRKQKFFKNRDIEDLAVVGNAAWVLQSNGTLYQVKNPFSENQTTKDFPFPHKGKKDIEAIVTIGTEPSLLIFCKACNWDKGPSQASVYKFDLKKESFEPEPFMVLKREDLPESAKGKFFNSLKIQPSGAAIHPLKGSLYLISSTGKWLMVMDREGKIQEIHPLDPFLFKQPEGITFDLAGNLYISNEAKDGRPNLLKFPYHP